MNITTTDPWLRELEFDLASALLRELIELFESMGQAPLDSAHVDRVPEQQGVYQLFLDRSLVYVGKTDSEAGLNKRLARHARKIHQRTALDPSRVTFKAVRVFVFTAMDLEQQLIKHYSSTSGTLSWNQSGFGANDPGRKRDTTALKQDHFDLKYPIDIDLPIVLVEIDEVVSIADMLKRLKVTLPYTLRFQNAGGNSKQPHPDLAGSNLTLLSGNYTVRQMLRSAQDTLGQDWQITVLPGYVIAYKEKKDYPHSRAL